MQLHKNPTVREVVAEFIKSTGGYCLISDRYYPAHPEEICACQPGEDGFDGYYCEHCWNGCFVVGGSEIGMTVREIVERFLQETDYDALWNPEGCGCQHDDLFVCGEGENLPMCQFGYLHSDGMIYLEKETE